MKVQGYWVLSLFIVAALTFAGCGDTATEGGGGTTTTESSDDSGSDAAESEDGGSDAKEGSDNASTETSSNFQNVSLSVPNMT